MPGSTRQHTHEFMNVHTDKRKYADLSEVAADYLQPKAKLIYGKLIKNTV